MDTFALGAIIIGRDCLLFQKIFHHPKKLPIVMVTEVNIDIPYIVKSY